METSISDAELAQHINEYIGANPGCSRRQVQQNCGTSHMRLKRLHEEGLVPAYPPAQSPSAAATASRRGRKWGRGFKLRGSPA